MEVYDLSEENGLDTYMSMEVPVSEGDEVRSLSQGQRRHHAHAAEDDEPYKRDPNRKLKILQARMNIF